MYRRALLHRPVFASVFFVLASSITHARSPAHVYVRFSRFVLFCMRSRFGIARYAVHSEFVPRALSNNWTHKMATACLREIAITLRYDSIDSKVCRS
jgi:hypothetical protein